MKGVFALTAFSTGESRAAGGEREREPGRRRWKKKGGTTTPYASSLNSSGRCGRGKIHFQVATDAPYGPPTAASSQLSVFYAESPLVLNPSTN